MTLPQGTASQHGLPSKDMLRNLVYLCGPHGAGKDTLARKVVELDPRVMVPELTTRTLPMPDDVPRRQYLKSCQRALEGYEYECIAQANPNSIVLGNRCALDDAAYRRAFVALGWMSEQERNALDGTQDNWCAQTLLAVVLNPQFEIVEKHLHQRWKESRKKWREDNMDYLQAVCTAYESYEGKPGILYLRDPEPTIVSAWLNTLLPQQRSPVDQPDTVADMPAAPQSLNTPATSDASCASNRKELVVF